MPAVSLKIKLTLGTDGSRGVCYEHGHERRRRLPTSTPFSRCHGYPVSPWHPTARGSSRPSLSSTTNAPSSSARCGNSIRPGGNRPAESPTAPRGSRHRSSPPTAICSSSPPGRVTMTTNRRSRSGGYPPPVARHSKPSRCPAVSAVPCQRPRPPWWRRRYCPPRRHRRRPAAADHAQRQQGVGGAARPLPGAVLGP